MVVDDLSRFSLDNTTHLVEEKKELVKDVHRLTRLGIQLMDFIDRGIVVTRVAKSSFLSQVKENQYQDQILLELKANNVHNQ